MLTEGYQIEIAGRLATMYLLGVIEPGSAATLRSACDALPASVQVLSVCLGEYAQLGSGGLAVLRSLHKHWRSSRKGAFRLAFAREGTVYALTIGDLQIRHGQAKSKEARAP